MLKINNLTYTYGSNLIFDRLSLIARNNKMTLFLSPNSCGKTTLIYLLAGLLPSNNSIKISNYYLNQKDGKNYLLNIGVVFEDLDKQFITDNIYDELSFPLINLGLDKKMIAKKIKKHLDFFCIDKNKEYIKNLNNLEKLILLIAVSTIHHPKFLLLDDVFNNIKNDEYIYLSKLLAKVSKLLNISIFMTTSNLEAGLYFDYAYLYNNYKIILEGTLNNIIENDNILIKNGIKVPSIILTSINLKNYGVIDDIYYEERTLVSKLWD